ncbi:hypothetical protein MPC1_2130002 [Methylocella tundrae]|nr:hypothetical protein MPC1_2130002 [Methylocella tundrae]
MVKEMQMRSPTEKTGDAHSDETADWDP